MFIANKTVHTYVVMAGERLVISQTPRNWYAFGQSDIVKVRISDQPLLPLAEVHMVLFYLKWPHSNMPLLEHEQEEPGGLLSATKANKVSL